MIEEIPRQVAPGVGNSVYYPGMENTCQHCSGKVEFGMTEQGFRGFVHVETGKSVCSTSTKTYLLGYVPGSFVRHLHSSLDDLALCGAMSVPQGDRKSADLLLPAVNGINCGSCSSKATSR